MHKNLLLTISTLAIPLVLYIFKKKKILQSKTGDAHQLVANNSNATLAGGLIFGVYFFYILNISNLGKFILPILLILLIGILSDLKILKSAKLRLLFQTIIVTFGVIYLDLKISPERIFIFDSLLKISFFNIIFTSFCILIVINGFNFIDGLNSLATGYFLLVFAILLKLNFFDFLNISNYYIYFLLYLTIFIIVLNFVNKVFLGDSGAYILGMVSAVFMIFLQNKYQGISPFFIVLVLWYPCYENLFSIIRKLILHQDPKKPDSNHLHQLILYYVQTKLKKNKNTSNNLSSCTILFYNFLILLISSFYIYNSSIQVLLILFNIVIYTIIYFLLFKIKKN